MKILIVDDSDIFRQSMMSLLGTLGEVESINEARNVKEGIDLAKAAKPDAVFLDIRLPDGTGFEVLQEIKKEPQPPMVIMLTNYSSEQFREKAFREGADYFFDKSTEFEKALEVLKG